MSRTEYEIVVQGHLDSEVWAAWFEECRLECRPEGTCCLVLPAADQAALHGILERIRDLGVELVSLRRIGRGDE